MEQVLSALGRADRVSVVIWLLKHGPARQVEIQKALSEERGVKVNSGALTPILRPLLDAGILERQRPRGPISIRDAPRIATILREAALIAHDRAEAGRSRASADFEDLRDALIRAAPAAGVGRGEEGS
jgi:hypothetical protein